MANAFSRRAAVLGGVVAGTAGWLASAKAAATPAEPWATDDPQTVLGMPEQIFIIRHA